VSKFDSIRPYEDHEVEKVLLDLVKDKDVIKTILMVNNNNWLQNIPMIEKLVAFFLRRKTKNIKTIKDYQQFFESIVQDVVNKTIDNFSIEGIDNLEIGKGYLFLSNHRDITLDSALLNLILHQRGINTTNNAVGNNLLSEKWASDLMRLNKSFIIDRSGKSKKDIYKSLHLASEFITNSILNNNQSVWIAQKQGRSKDGIDFTDPAVLKMIHLNSRKTTSVSDFFNNISLIPVAISYQKDPNDLLKAKELYLTSINSVYEKEPREDLLSISDGITGNKGNVHLYIGEPMKFESNSYDDIAELITKKIKTSYKNHSTNIAACIMQGIHISNHEFTENEIDEAMEYLNQRMHLIPEEMHPFLLKQYSNSVYRL
jgi:1-acyl-sn-glycerol-3-phosphate acyltransferase